MALVGLLVAASIAADAGLPSAAPAKASPTPPAATPAAPATPPATPPAASPTPPATPPAPRSALPQTGFGWLLVQMVLVLLAVCALAYVLLRWGLRRFERSGALRAGGMRVVERLGLEPRRSLFVVEVARRYFLLGTSENGIALLAEIDAETAAEIERRRQSATERPSFRDMLFRRK